MVAVQTVTKQEFRSPQTHEFEAIQKIIPAVQAKGFSLIFCYGIKFLLNLRYISGNAIMVSQ